MYPKPRTPRRRATMVRWCASLITALLLAGCQSYQASPLDLESHHEAWFSRSPIDEPVREFVSRLNERGNPAAASFDPNDGLTLGEGELIALVYNPDLRVARLRAGVTSATAVHAGRWDDPSFSIDVLRITESVPNPWVISPGLSLTIPISGRLEVEQSRADAALRSELFRVAEAEWRTRLDVRTTWHEWSAAQLRIDVTQKFIESMDSLVQSTQELAEAGELVRTEAALFAIEQTYRRQELTRLRSHADEAAHRLLALLGLSPDTPVVFVPMLEFTIDEGDVSNRAITDENPLLRRLREEYEVAEHSLHLEIRKQYPDLTIGPRYESDEGQSRIGFSGGLPLPIINVNKQGIAEAEAVRELARAAYETEYERLTGRLSATLARAVSIDDQLSQLNDDMAPLVDRQLEDARGLLDLGEGSGLVLLESLVRAHETKLLIVDIRLDESLVLAEITSLVGPFQINSPTLLTNTMPDREVTE